MKRHRPFVGLVAAMAMAVTPAVPIASAQTAARNADNLIKRSNDTVGGVEQVRQRNGDGARRGNRGGNRGTRNSGRRGGGSADNSARNVRQAARRGARRGVRDFVGDNNRGARRGRGAAYRQGYRQGNRNRVVNNRRAFRQGYRRGNRNRVVNNRQAYRRGYRRGVNRGYVYPRYRAAPRYYAPRYRAAPRYRYARTYHRPVFRNRGHRYFVGGYYTYHPRTVVVKDYYGWGLYDPPYGYHWVADYDTGDVVLASIATGAIIGLAIGLLAD